MIAKTLIAAAAISAAVSTIAPVQQAEAKTKIDIDVNFGGGYGGWYPGYGYNPYPIYQPSYGVSCGMARNIVRNHGFYNVNAFDCSKPIYQYTAWKYGQPYKVKVSLGGAIIKVVHL